jgi:pyridoxamine 5'-phosphate oxidase
MPQPVSSSHSNAVAFANAEEDPFALYDAWLSEAAQSEPNDPNAAALATATASGLPSVRMVLVKPVAFDHSGRGDAGRWCFFTNAESRKGQELGQNPNAALCFHWKSLRRQVRVVGQVTELAAADVDRYFHSRSRLSQIGAAVSEQSRVLASREALEAAARAFAESHPGEIPRPAYWRGYRLHPAQIEFWIDGAHRLHDRFLFTFEDNRWQRVRLYP